MKSKVIAATMLLILAVTLQLALLPCVKANPHTDITVAQAYTMVYSGSYPNLVVMDVRTTSDYNAGHIQGAINVPVIPPSPFDFTALYAWISSPEGQSHKNDEIIVYCGTGTRSNLTSNILEANGYTKVYDMLGAYPAWVAAGYPVYTNVNTDVWFVALYTGGWAERYWTDGGTILHSSGNSTWRLYRSPQTGGSVIIGSAQANGSMVFNNVTQRGKYENKMTLNLSETNSTMNPYGVGTIEARVTVDLTSLLPPAYTGPGNGTGFLLATQGTGAFAHAMLWGHLSMYEFPLGPNSYTPSIFFGTHPRVNGVGRLEYNSLKGTYRDWKVMLYDSSVYLVPPAILTNAPIIMSIGTWNDAYYSKIGMTIVDAAKPAIDDIMSSPNVR